MYRKKSDELDRQSRRRVFPGYPIETPFNSVEEVREYVSGDSIICLLCGKKFKRLNIHLHFIHEMEVDEYKEKYNIPWTYALACEESSKLSADALTERIDKGEFKQSFNLSNDQLNKIRRKKKRSCPFANEIAKDNIKEYLSQFPLIEGEDGILRTKRDDIKNNRTKRGTPEYKEVMIKKSKKMVEEGRCHLIGYWKGRKQTPDHIAKRIESRINNKKG